MVKTLVAFYRDISTAQQVVQSLLEAGFSGDDISLIANTGQGGLAMPIRQEVSAGEGARFGALVGALVGIGSALVPGIGPVIGGGVLGVALTVGIGAAAGAVTGGITVEALELSEDENEDDNAMVRHANSIVSVATNDQWMEWAQQILARYEPLKVEERAVKWYNSEWGVSEAQTDSHSAALQSDSKLRIPRLKPVQQSASAPDTPPVRAQIYDN